MPNEAVINNAKAKAAKVQELAKNAVNALQELVTMGKVRENAGVDFASIDYANDPSFGHLGSADIDKAIDNAVDLLNNAANLYRVIR